MTNRINFFPAYVATPLVFLAVAIISGVITYSGTPYQLDQIKVHLENAEATNNIGAKIQFMTEAYVRMQPYHGNSGLFWTDEMTNIDTTKQILADSIVETSRSISIDNKTQYMVLPNPQLNSYINGQIDNVGTRIADYNQNYMSNPQYSFLVVGLLMTPSSLVLVLVVDSIANRNRSYY